MKNILTIILVAMFCLGSVEAMAQRTITRQSTSQPVRPTKEQQYQKDLKAGEKLFNQEKYAEAKKYFAKMLGKYPNHKEDISGWIAACDVMLGDSAGDAEVQSQTSGLADKNFFVNGVSFKMVAVKGGTFTMGATSEQGSDVDSDEKPTHSVTLSDYYIGETEVTQALWEAVMGSNPSYFKGSNLPVEYVSWEDCQEFISRLNSLTGKTFSLPTEAEWEYAARGGVKSKGYKYSGGNTLDKVAWHEGNSGKKTHAVKQKQANELGLYDMTGNVWEWCLDWYGSYSSGSQTNPTGPTSGTLRTLRGGSWNSDANTCRVSYRSNGRPNYHLNTNDFTYGFRIVCTP